MGTHMHAHNKYTRAQKHMKSKHVHIHTYISNTRRRRGGRDEKETDEAQAASKQAEEELQRVRKEETAQRVNAYTCTHASTQA